MKLFYQETGVLLKKTEPDFETYLEFYNPKLSIKMNENTYCKKSGYAIKAAKKFVEDGLEGTYAIVENPVEKEVYDGYNPADKDSGIPVMGHYLTEEVYYCVAKINGEIVEDFLNKDLSNTDYVK